MSNEEKETLISKLEKGRAEFAYKCAEEGKKIVSKNQINGEWYEDNKYASHVKKLSTMIISNGLGQTLAFVFSKRTKPKEERNGVRIDPGHSNNPKNGYDLIYKHLTDYLKSDFNMRIRMPDSENDLVKWIISLNSYQYRYVTEEVLSFIRWLKRFVEGMIEGESNE